MRYKYMFDRLDYGEEREKDRGLMLLASFFAVNGGGADVVTSSV